MEGRQGRGPGASVEQRDSAGRSSAAEEQRSSGSRLLGHVQSRRRDESQAASGRQRIPGSSGLVSAVEVPLGRRGRSTEYQNL